MMEALFPSGVAPVAATILILVALTCAVTDIWKARIYNVVTYPAIIVGLVLQLWLHGKLGLVSGLAGFAVGFVPAFLLFTMGAMGGGDVKLLAAVGTLGGALAATETMVLSYLIGGFFALGLLAWHGTLGRSTVRVIGWLISFVIPGWKTKKLLEEGEPRREIRFGVAICFALLVTLWDMHSGVAWSGLS